MHFGTPRCSLEPTGMPDSERRPTSRTNDRMSRARNCGKGKAIHIISGTPLGLTRMPDSERQLTAHQSDRASERAQRASEQASES